MQTIDVTQRARLLRNLDSSEARKERTYAAQRVELRAAADGGTTRTFTGYASVVDAPYDIYGGPAAGGWTETIARQAFTKTLSERPDVAFLINHTGMTLARTKSGTLTLAADDHGLAVEASLDSRQGPVNDLAVAMERGDIDEMSFAFRVLRDKWTNADGEEVPYWDLAGINRTILEVSINKGDVSVVNYGANPATSADLRALFAEARAGRPMSREARAMLLAALGADDDTPPPPAPPPPAPPAPAGMTLAQARMLAGI